MSKKTVLITGASGGIGSAIAKRFAADGCNIVITGRYNADALHSLETTIKESGCECLSYLGDLSVSEYVSALFDKISDRFGAVDILINNLGISYVGLITDMSDDEWHEVIETNLSSAFYCCRRAIPPMVSKKEGRIINISSVWGSVGASCEAAYSASKGGINAFTRALAKELAPSGVSVNAVACGLIDTKMNDHLSIKEMQNLCEEIPAGRAGMPEEVAELVHDITTQSTYLTGQIIALDGGWI